MRFFLYGECGVADALIEWVYRACEIRVSVLSAINTVVGGGRLFLVLLYGYKIT